VRRAWGARFKAEEGYSLTYLPFVARAASEALRQFPNLNASVGVEALLIHQDINLAIAVDLDHEGLIVPVVHRAEEFILRGMARRIRTWPTGPGPASCGPTTSPAAPSRSPTTGRSGPS